MITGLSGIAENIFATVSQVITGFIASIGEVFNRVVGAFYTDADGLTLLGILALLGFVVALVRWGFNLILRLIKIRKS